jgi:hypothetical protein
VLFGSRAAGSLIASALLVALTVSVFAVSQNRGPEGAVSRFQEAVVRNDTAMLESALLQPPGHPDSQVLVAYIARLRQLNPAVRYVNQTKRGKSGQVVALYTAPTGRPIAFVPFVVRKVGATWRVDAVATVEILRRL